MYLQLCDVQYDWWLLWNGKHEPNKQMKSLMFKLMRHLVAIKQFLRVAVSSKM